VPKKIRNIKKPKKLSLGRVYLWRDITKFILDKYRIDIYASSGGNFWDWISGIGDMVHNGSFMYIAFNDWIEDPDTEEWIKDVLRTIKKEFSPRRSYMTVWVDW
jgi:hypothetical protein